MSRFLVCGAAALCVVTAAAPDPASLANRLGANTARERRAAADGLRALGQEAVPTLERAAASDDAQVRTSARAILARLAEERDASVQRVSAQRRTEADLVLRRNGVPSTHDFAPGTPLDDELARLSPESSGALAAAVCARARQHMVDERLAEALVRRPVPATLDALAEIWLLDMIAPSAALRAAMALATRVPGDPSLSPAGHRAAERLIGYTRTIDAPRRRTRVALVAAFEGAAAEAFLTDATRDQDAGVRAEAVLALGQWLPAASAATLRQLAADPAPTVRVAALEALRNVPGVPHPEPAVAAAADPVVSVRRAAATLLGRDATVAELPLLRELATDISPSVRAAARASLLGLDQ